MEQSGARRTHGARRRVSAAGQGTQSNNATVACALTRTFFCRSKIRWLAAPSAQHYGEKYSIIFKRLDRNSTPAFARYCPWKEEERTCDRRFRAAGEDRNRSSRKFRCRPPDRRVRAFLRQQPFRQWRIRHALRRARLRIEMAWHGRAEARRPAQRTAVVACGGFNRLRPRA
jgi:hypothetical protein